MPHCCSISASAASITPAIWIKFSSSMIRNEKILSERILGVQRFLHGQHHTSPFGRLLPQKVHLTRFLDPPL
jgi:hypothetical protein